MRKNKIFYFVILFLITLFSFNLDVYAAQELTCLYKKEARYDKVLLIQYSNGDRKIFKNEKNVDIEDKGWVITDFNASDFDDSITLDSNGNLDSCPGFVNTSGDGNVKFYAKRGISTRTKIQAKFDKVSEPVYNSVVTPSINSELSDAQVCSSDTWLSEIDGTKYTGACLYKKTIDDKCHLIQINYGKNNLQVTEYDPVKGFKYSGKYNVISDDGWYYEFDIDREFSTERILDEIDGDCLGAIRVSRSVLANVNGNGDLPSVETKIYFGNEKGQSYQLANVKGNNPLTGEALTMGIRDDIILFEKAEVDECSDLLGEDITKILGVCWTFVKIGVPILLIVLGTIDFGQAVISGNEDGMKKAQGKFIKRVIIAVVIFLIPVILSFLLSIANGIWGNIGSDICGILF